MELREKIETINRQLVDHFGVDTVTGLPMWRVVWSNDQKERRLVGNTSTGVELLFPEVREVPKYQHARDRFILERLIGLDPISQMEYPEQKTYYNAMWTFSDRFGNYLPPYFEGCKFLIDTTYSKEGKVNIGSIYNDPELDPQTKKDRLEALVLELFGEHPEHSEARGDTVIGFHPKIQ